MKNGKGIHCFPLNQNVEYKITLPDKSEKYMKTIVALLILRVES